MNFNFKNMTGIKDKQIRTDGVHDKEKGNGDSELWDNKRKVCLDDSNIT